MAPSRRRALAVLLVVALAGWEPFRAPDPDVEAGNRAYAEGRYDDALAAYDQAARRGAVDGDGLAFDRGTAELAKAAAVKDPDEKRRLTERAIEDLKQAARARDARIRGSANYNRGNALMDRDKLDDAIEAYKQALRDDAGLDDARVNLELALRRRQKQQRQQPQQGQGQGQGQQGQGQRGQGQGQGQSQGQGPQGQGQGQGSAGGSDQNGSNAQGSNQGSNDQGSGAQGSNQSGSNGQGSNQSGSNGQGSPQDGSNGGSNQNGSNDPDARRSDDQNGQPSNGPLQRGRPQRERATPRSPKTPTDGKLDDLDSFSRRLQKDRARRHATGRPTDPQRDW